MSGVRTSHTLQSLESNCGIRICLPTPECLGGGAPSISISNPSDADANEVGRLLARTPVVRSACDLDLLVFLHRHPRTLLTSEQLSAFVGHDIKEIAKSLEAFIEAGLLERTQNPMHAARMYLLVLDGPHHDGIRDLLKFASTRSGRRNVLLALDVPRSQSSKGSTKGQRPLLKIA